MRRAVAGAVERVGRGTDLHALVDFERWGANALGVAHRAYGRSSHKVVKSLLQFVQWRDFWRPWAWRVAAAGDLDEDTDTDTDTGGRGQKGDGESE